jgi:hypothetical protein
MYDEDELKIGQGGDTPLCPFDCECCMNSSIERSNVQAFNFKGECMGMWRSVRVAIDVVRKNVQEMNCFCSTPRILHWPKCVIGKLNLTPTPY